LDEVQVVDSGGSGSNSSQAQSDGGDYLSTLGLSYSAAGVVGDAKLKSGRFTQLNGGTGNFNDRPYKRLSQWAKTNKTFAQNLSKAGKLGNGLVVATTVYDVLDDGNLRTSTAINATLTGVAIAFPAAAPLVLLYGVLDYNFEFSEYIDAHSSGINTGIYD